MIVRNQSEMENSQVQVDNLPEMPGLVNIMTIDGLAPFLGTLLFGKCPMFGASASPSTLARIQDDASQGFAPKKKKSMKRPQTIDKIPSSVEIKVPLESELNSRGTVTTVASTSSLSSTKSTNDEMLQAYRQEADLPSGEAIDRGTADEEDTLDDSDSKPQKEHEALNNNCESQTNCDPDEQGNGSNNSEAQSFDDVNKETTELSRDCQINKKSKKKKKKARVILPENFRVGLSRTESFAQTASVGAKSQKSALSNKSAVSRATSIVSASKSVKSLPREVELESIDEGSLPSANDSRLKSNKKSKAASEVIQVNDLVLTDPYGVQGKYSGCFAKQSRRPHGFGRFESSGSGDWYEGEFRHGERIGLGRMSQNQEFYQGNFYGGEPHGEGVKKFADGRTFEGSFLQGNMSQGTMTYPDGSIYTGGWVNGMRHGKGQTIFEDSSVYVGQFQSGVICGFGKMLWMDGGYYEGEWENGLQEGFGKEVLKNGEVRHEGLWTQGLPIRKD